MSRLLAASLRAGAVLLALCAGMAAADAQTPPLPVPPPQAEIVPAVPPGAWVWQPGHWHWNGVQYVWRPGHYVHPHPHRIHWIEGHWVLRHRGWVWIPGHWG